MKKFLRAVAASGIATATVAGGLALGPAASAAPAPSVDASPSGYPYIAGQTGHLTGDLVVKNNDEGAKLNYARKATGAQRGIDTQSTPTGSEWEFPRIGEKGLVRNVDSGLCLSLAAHGAYPGPAILSVPCDANDPAQRISWYKPGGSTPDNGYNLLSDKSTAVVTTNRNGGLSYSDDKRAEVLVDGHLTPVERNGGITAEESAPTNLRRGEPVEVPFAVGALEKYTSLDATVTLTAPAGTTFAPDQQVMGQWADDKGTWNASGDLSLSDVRVSADGKQLKGEFHSADGFTQWRGYQLRWFASVVADADATSGEATLRYEITGRTNIGKVSVDATSPTRLDVVNGGVTASRSDTTTLQPGKPTEVPFAIKATGRYDELHSNVTLTAPAGTTFDEGQTVEGEWADEHGTWHGTAAGLQLQDVRIFDGGTKLTGRVDVSQDFEQYTDWQLRWHATVTASSTATPGDGALRYEMGGTTNRGTFTIDSTSATVIPAPEVVVPAPTAEGYFPKDVHQWAGIAGAAQPGATVIARDADGHEIGRTQATDTGAYNIGIDPGKVGMGEQSFTVTQEVDGVASDGIGVTLDYGQNAPAWTAPTNGGTLPGSGWTLTGTGTPGAEVQVNGTDFTTGAELGTTTVANGTWSLSSADLDLPAGPYQLWVNQFTKGGKWANAGINVTVEATKPAAPTAEGYFPKDVHQWAGIAGAAQPGATVIARDAQGHEIGRTQASGTGAYDIGIDPGKVGMGEQSFTVTQEHRGGVSDGIGVTLDYGQNAPAWTAPTNGGTLPGTGWTLTGTGTPGAEIGVNGTDFTTGAKLGTTTVDASGSWSLSVDGLDLPAGPYQFWVNQFTKGGKWAHAGVNATVTG